MKEGTTTAEVPVLLLKPEEAALALRISRTAIYNLIKTGEIESIQIGRLRRISVDVLRTYITQLQDRAAAA